MSDRECVVVEGYDPAPGYRPPPTDLERISQAVRPDTNPKSAVGIKKPSFHAIPAVAEVHLGRAMADGERKYGLMNWREHPVAATVYYDAIRRHLTAWFDGRQQNAEDSGIHHLGHIMACCAILLDAEEQGNLIDDRPAIASRIVEVLERFTQKQGSAAKFPLAW